MVPAEVNVSEGDKITLNITGDEAVEFHLHGYDLKSDLQPGTPAAISFEAALAGRFEIEDESNAEVLGALVVQPR